MKKQNESAVAAGGDTVAITVWKHGQPNVGVYYLYRLGALVYIGQTCDIMSRISQHRAVSNFSFDEARVVHVSNKDKREDLERAEIKKHKPIHNKALVSKLTLAEVVARTAWILRNKKRAKYRSMRKFRAAGG